MSKKIILPCALAIVFTTGVFIITNTKHERSIAKKSADNGIENILKKQKITQHQMGTSGDYTDNSLDAQTYLSSWNFNNLPPDERQKYYRETPLPDGSKLREYWFEIIEKEIEVAPGVFYPAWTYNGQVPGPTIRTTEGDTIKINFDNKGSKPHTIHSHGFHPASMDGALPEHLVLPGETFSYEFLAEPFGLQLYHCHSVPVSEHISKGLYGVYIVDPKIDTRPKADNELIMVMNGFDVNFDGENEIYAVNSQAFVYNRHNDDEQMSNSNDNTEPIGIKPKPINVKKGELVRIYLVNMLEFDQLNSFHLHGNFFDEYPTGTKMDSTFFTDTTTMGQGERSILDVRFRFPGEFMFHAHKNEFGELGWMGLFNVE